MTQPGQDSQFVGECTEALDMVEDEEDKDKDN